MPNAYPAYITYSNGTNADQDVVVTADFNGGGPVELAAALGVTFGAAGCLALWLHDIAVELYAGSTSHQQNLSVCARFLTSANSSVVLSGPVLRAW
ncbi:hypothetical protein B0A55_13164 [Friedmanniomyces simplex]|uniref:Uncharacterized protein n=1 Tax=Friedmanniomyces simplex TaxID=329884 RepID=A0A4U0WW87_9PEZI|nr:hypothetical protein B0A55_13164 [Friedmanniomyces simplex]